MLNVCTTNALARVMIGRRVFADLLSGGDHKDAGVFKEMVVEMMVLAGVFNVGDFVPVLEPLDLQGVAKKMKNLHQRFDDFLTGIIEDHRKSEGEGGVGHHTDLLSVLMGLKDGDGEGGGKLSDTEIKALLLVLSLSPLHPHEYRMIHPFDTSRYLRWGPPLITTCSVTNGIPLSFRSRLWCLSPDVVW